MENTISTTRYTLQLAEHKHCAWFFILLLSDSRKMNRTHCAPVRVDDIFQPVAKCSCIRQINCPWNTSTPRKTQRNDTFDLNEIERCIFLSKFSFDSHYCISFGMPIDYYCLSLFLLFHPHIELFFFSSSNQIESNAMVLNGRVSTHTDTDTNFIWKVFVFATLNLPSHYWQWECVSAVVANSNGYEGWWRSRYEYRWRRRLCQNRGCIDLTMAGHWQCCIRWWMTDYVIVQNIG